MAKATPPIYKVQISADAPELGVQLVSFVNTPAVGVNFVTLAAEPSLQVALKADSKKQLLTGPVLIPDIKIPRIKPEDKSLYYMTFSADVIEQLRDRFHEQNHTQATNLEHETPLEGNHVVESWIVTDAEKDKAYALGFTAEEVPVGTWMASYKVTDTTLWAEQIETGNVRGFSMEGLLGYTTLSSQLSMQKNPRPAGKLATFFSELKKLVLGVALATLTLDDDSTVEVDDTTAEVFTVDAEGNRGDKLADGTYKLKDGGELVVKDGKQVKADDTAARTESTTTAPAVTTEAAKLAEEAAATTTAVEASSITLDNGEVITHDPIGKKLYKADGTLLPTGKYKTDKGVMFKVTTDQWWYETQETLSAQLDERDKTLLAKDEEIKNLEAKLAQVQADLNKKPAAAPIKVEMGDKGAKAAAAAAEVPKTRGQELFAQAQALSGLK
jgi:predicted RecA/RadA family phage recombinase